jgi:hypothetical protein
MKIGNALAVAITDSDWFASPNLHDERSDLNAVRSSEVIASGCSQAALHRAHLERRLLRPESS